MNLIEGAVATWSGKMVVEGGGFCGVASPQMGLDLAEYDGLCLRVKGNGETFKLNIKTTDQVCIEHRHQVDSLTVSAGGIWYV